MNGIVRTLTLSAFALLLSSAVYAADNEKPAPTIEPQDIVFHTTGGGKYIYNNNPEGIDDAAMADGDEPRYISSYGSLGPDTYYLYMSYFNLTGGGKRGYTIEVDTSFTALEDTVLTIKNAAFETIRVQAYEYSSNVYCYMKDWEFVGVCADMLGKPIIDMRGAYRYDPAEYKPVTVHIKKGETVWLSQYLDDYMEVLFGDPVHYQALIELESGSIDMNTAALRYNGKLGDRSKLPDNIGFGIYRYDYTVKGIADTLPQVKTDTLHYTIDDTTASGTALPGTVYNQYSPEGNTVEYWCSNINPVADYWSKYTAAESDMIQLKYKDDNKLTYYGKNVTEKDNVWVFDTRHTSASKYESAYGFSQDNYSPNFEVSDIFRSGIENYACNLGNYGVTETYELEITNNGSKDRYFQYEVMTKSNVISYAADEDGNFKSANSKGMTNEAVFTPMVSVKLPAGETTRFSVNMFIPVNVNGGIQNKFTIADSDNVKINDYVSKTDAYPFTGVSLETVKDKLGEKASAEFSDNIGSYEIIDGGDIHLVRWCSWDGNLYYYSNLWGYCNTVYVLDSSYEIINKFTLPVMPNEADIANGVIYVRDLLHGIYASYDNGATWSQPGISEIPHEITLSKQIGELSEARLVRADGTSVTVKLDVPEYIGDMSLVRYEKGSLDDREFSDIVINGKYHIGSGMDINGVRYIAENDMLLKNIVSNAALKNDTASEWAKPYMEKAYNYGIVPLYMKEGSFTEPLTRMQFCDLIYEMLLCCGVQPEQGKAFTDCSDPHILALAGAGIINGVTDTEFMPYSSITREQAAAVLARTASYLGASTSAAEVYIADTVSDWAKDPVYRMYNAGIMDGVGEDKFDAYGLYTKEQSIAAQTRLYEYVLTDKPEKYLPPQPDSRSYYAVYKELYRGGRIEMTCFDTLDKYVPKLIDSDVLTIDDETKYTNDMKYTLSCGAWLPFESGYVRISNMNGGLIISNI